MKTEKQIREYEIERHSSDTWKDGKKNSKFWLGYQTEDAMLADFVVWAKNTYPQLRYSFFHPANEGINTGGQYAAFRGAQAKAKGQLSGVPDIVSVHEGKLRCAEFKLPQHRNSHNGGRSDRQEEIFQKWHHKWNIPIFMIYCFEDWKQFIEIIVLRNES